MTLEETMAELAAKGSSAVKRLWIKHGATEPFFGVKIGDLKVIHRKIKGDQALALALFATGNGDAQYLAGMVADGRRMSTTQINAWAKTAAWKMISGTTVPWVAAEHPSGLALALKWIEAKDEGVVGAGWNTLSGIVATVPDEQLPMAKFAELLDRVVNTIGTSPGRVRYVMNGFVIACGTYVAPLGRQAMAAAKQIGKVEVDMGDTECRVPDAASYILKARRGAPIAAKRKTIRC